MIPIDIQVVNRALVGTRFAGKVQHFAAVTSTNTLLLEAAAEGAAEGTVFVADEQTAGRGRGGNAWHSAPGDGLYMSALVKPELRLRDALHLSLATGLAAWQAIHELSHVSIDLHWPNDLYVGPKKLGGILVETSSETGADQKLRYAVIGIGVNVHQTAFPAALSDAATSLALESAMPVSRERLLVSLLRQVDIELMRLEGASLLSGGNLLQRFIEFSTWARGRRVHVPEQGGYTGRTAGLDEQGFLLVDCDDGVRRTVLSGGVRATE